jgi:hypothetical protein
VVVVERAAAPNATRAVTTAPPVLNNLEQSERTQFSKSSKKTELSYLPRNVTLPVSKGWNLKSAIWAVSQFVMPTPDGRVSGLWPGRVSQRNRGFAINLYSNPPSFLRERGRKSMEESQTGACGGIPSSSLESGRLFKVAGRVRVSGPIPVATTVLLLGAVSTELAMAPQV